MSKNKNKTTQNSSSSWTSSYDQIKPQETADTQAVRDWKPANDPSIPYAFARAAGNIKNTFANPLGADTPASVREAIERSSYGELGQQEAQARSQESYSKDALNLNKLMWLDERTAPKIVQTSGTGQSSGTTIQEQKATPFSIISGVAQGALAF